MKPLIRSFFDAPTAGFYWVCTGISTGGALILERPVAGGTSAIRARLTWPWGDTVRGHVAYTAIDALRALDRACMDDCATEMRERGAA
jgi:hypothetical protein